MKLILLSVLFASTASFAHHNNAHLPASQLTAATNATPNNHEVELPLGCISEYEAEITLEYELTWGDLIPQRKLPAGYLMTLSTSIKWQELGDVYYSGKAFYTQAFDPYNECDDDRSCYDMYKIDCDGIVTKYIDNSDQ